MNRTIMKKNLSWLLVVLFLSLMIFHPVSAQESDYGVHLRRNFGYGGGSNIRGTFTISLVGDEMQVDKVNFRVDDEVMATVLSAPFQYKFHTDDFGPGTHRLSAEVFFADQGSLITPAVQYNFVSPSEEREQVTTILVGVGGAIIVTMALVAFIQMLMTGSKSKTSKTSSSHRRYGILGGTICPKCGQPFSRHIWGMNLVVGRLERCDHCGKWVMTVRATPAALRAAEQLETDTMSIGNEHPEKTDHRRDGLDDTKYIDKI